MTITFSQSLPADYYGEVEVISGQCSLLYPGSEYLFIQLEGVSKAFEIKYEYHCSPFKEAAIHGNLLLAGHEGHFYLYDLKSKQNVLTLEMGGYFGHLYVYQDHFYVADAGTLFCLNSKGNIIWRNTHLGIDGVTIEKFTESEIYGSGACDPPGGWIGFVLDIKTGENVKEKVG